MSDTYASGNGILYGQLTATQKTDWGLVAWNNLSESSGNAVEAHASNDLTDNNTVTVADGPEAAAQGSPGDGDAVIEWLSREGSSLLFTQATAAKRPTARTGANGINGRTLLEFNGTNHLLELASAPLSAAASLTLSLPIKTGASAFAADQVIFATSDTGTATTYFCVGLDSSGNVYVEGNDAATVYRATGDTVLSVSTFYSITITDTGSAIAIEVGDVTQTLTETGTYKGISDLTGLDNTTYAALKHTSEEDFFEGKIPEHISYAPVISADDKTTLENYVNRRYVA